MSTTKIQRFLRLRNITAYFFFLIGKPFVQLKAHILEGKQTVLVSKTVYFTPQNSLFWMLHVFLLYLSML